ncbi:MAG TPA: DUF4436 domain-containing protein [Mycobacterium sp.]|nr:DUF4436 domain-containing protein [Mycobacterium sp.]
MKFSVVGLVVLIAAYIATIALYAGTGLGRPHGLVDGRATADGTTVIMDIEELQSVKGVLTANLTVDPGPKLLDPDTAGLNEELTVVVTSVIAPTKRTWSKGAIPGVFPVPLTITGDPSNWPFDRYFSGPITVELIHDGVRERAWVTFVDRIPGWKVDVQVAAIGDEPAPYRVELHRSPSTAAFATVVVAVLIAIAGMALFVAVQTARGRRKFQPPMTTWYAALLFSVVPLRNALPDPPPIGFWIDVTVVLWVIVVLVASMMLYVYCWWRDLAPDSDKPD